MTIVTVLIVLRNTYLSQDFTATQWYALPPHHRIVYMYNLCVAIFNVLKCCIYCTCASAWLWNRFIKFKVKKLQISIFMCLCITYYIVASALNFQGIPLNSLA